MQNRKLRILIVDDQADRILFKPLRLRLEKAGYEIVTTLNGEDGLEAAKNAYQDNKPFDIVLMDRWMPLSKNTPGGKGGEEITIKWRQWEKDNNIPRHFIVSHSSDQNSGQIEGTDVIADKCNIREIQSLINDQFPQFAQAIPVINPSVQNTGVSTNIFSSNSSPVIPEIKSQATFPSLSRCGFFAIATTVAIASAGIYYANNYLNPR